MHPIAIFLPPLTIAFASGVLFRRLWFISPSLEAIDPKRLDGLFRYKESDQAPTDAAFWNDSHGLAGVLHRWEQTIQLVAILRDGVARGSVTREEARQCWQAAAVQTFYSLKSLPEAAACRIYPRLSHINALASLRAHIQLTLSVTMLCRGASLPECVFEGRDLL